MSQTVAVLGTGGMGAGMAQRLLDEGFRVRAWNRTPAKVQPLVAAGAELAGSPAEAAKDADVVLLSLENEDVVRQVLFGPDGALTTLARGRLIVDTSTTSAEAAQSIGAAATRSGHVFVEARVLGNPQHARTGQLRVMAGGAPSCVEQAQPILASLGKQVTRVGEWGAGAHMKIALNLFLGIQLAGLAEAVDIAEAAGLERADVLSVLGGSGYSSPVVAFRCELVNARRLEPAAFRLALMDKDLQLATDLATRGGIEAPVTQAAAARFRDGVERGRGHLDAVAVVLPASEPLSAAS